MTHAEAIRDAERRVVEAAIVRTVASVSYAQEPNMTHASAVDATERAENAEVGKLIALRAQTCPECNGAGYTTHGIAGYDANGTPLLVHSECPAKCDNGRRR